MTLLETPNSKTPKTRLFLNREIQITKPNNQTKLRFKTKVVTLTKFTKQIKLVILRDKTTKFTETEKVAKEPHIDQIR